MEDELSFKQANLYNMMSIYLEAGEPTRQGWRKLSVFLVDYYNPDWNIIGGLREPHDHEFFTFTEVQRLAVRTLDKVVDVKKALA